MTYLPLSCARMCSAVCLLALFVICSLARAQERYVVSSVDGNLNVYNLSDNSFVESFGAGANPFQIVVSPNHRIGYFPNLDNAYASVVDFTIQREIERIYGIDASGNLTAGLTPDGKLLLIPTLEGTLDVISTTDFHILDRVDLTGVVGPASLVTLSSVVAVNNKAYVNTSVNLSSNNAVAVVDLSSFQASGIPVPPAMFNNTFLAGDTAATPDGRFVLMLQSSNVLLIDTSSDTVVKNIELPTNPYLIAVTPLSKENNVFGYLVCDDGNGGIEAVVMDLRSGSPTFGQLVPGADVELSHTYFLPASIAINGDGTRLIVMALQATAPQPDTYILNTAAMLTNPHQAILSQLRLENTLGPFLHNVVIAPVETVPPTSAPVITAVKGSPINDRTSTIEISGFNFGKDAFVRIGAMAPLSAYLISDQKLKVRVPQNAPAGDGLDVIVTNRNASAPLEQQQQSGLRPAGLRIQPNPAFQPHQQAVTADEAQNSISLLLKSRVMKTFLVGHEPGTFAFSPEGLHVYVELQTTGQIACFNLSENTLENVIVPPLGGALYPGGIVMAKSPASGTAVLYVGTYSCQQGCSINLLQIDANPFSPTFNKILNTYKAALKTFGIVGGSTGATPDGHYVYVSEANSTALTVFDIVKQSSVTLSTNTLGVHSYQGQVTVAPDGKSLLLNSNDGGIDVFDISADPLNPVLIASIAPVLPQGIASLFLYSYQVQNDRLVAFDASHNTVEMFNFDRSAGNYSFLGANVIPGHSAYSAYVAVSPDGRLVYVPQNGEDAVAALDANLLGANQPALITKLATGRTPNAAAVSPVSW